ncbi:neuron-specific vesicular protein calcyon, partial [Carlito syrichta]|uniref:Neuron-specific vesicular protein calcyon n=1 Tax=Carlito syrichta TaxID=1868482 RepID=A0A3Q0DFF5_CARSF
MVKLGCSFSVKPGKEPGIQVGAAMDGVPLISPLDVSQLQPPFTDQVVIKTQTEYQLSSPDQLKNFTDLEGQRLNFGHPEEGRRLPTARMIAFVMALLGCVLIMYKAIWYDQFTCPDGFLLRVSGAWSLGPGGAVETACPLMASGQGQGTGGVLPGSLRESLRKGASPSPIPCPTKAAAASEPVWGSRRAAREQAWRLPTQGPSLKPPPQSLESGCKREACWGRKPWLLRAEEPDTGGSRCKRRLGSATLRGQCLVLADSPQSAT